MSIDRFKNKDLILATNTATIAQTYDSKDANLLVKTTNKLTALPDDAFVEFHAYTQDGLYVGGINDLRTKIPVIGSVTSDITPTVPFNTLNIKFDILQAFRAINLQRGTYKFSITSYKSLIGTNDTKPFYIDIDGISPDRTELKLVVRTDARISTAELTNFRNYQIAKTSKQSTADNLVINFGSDNVYKVLNVKRVTLSTFGDGYYIKLYEPLPAFITDKDTAWLGLEVSDTYVDTVTIIGEAPKPSFIKLRGPNFDFDVTGFQNTETTLKSWNDLLAANTITAQTVIDRFFSGSITDTDLPIDYTAFENFVFYGSAAERLANFKYKLELLEYYDGQISLITGSTASTTSFAVNNIDLNQKRKDALIGTFDGFERWLYYEPTSSLFTHALSGSFIGAEGYALTTYPKYLYSGSYRLHHTTSSIATTWYNSFASTASFYDEQNGNALVNHIPEYIRLDERNDEFITFVNMIAQHYDTLWTYVDALTKIRTRDEHPKLGIPKQLVYSLAQQYGVNLINGRQTSDLWQYKLGVNSSGSYQSTGSMFSKSEEDLVTDVWRRIVLNMPYLLKTKGTSRSIKALLNTYGIPQTLVSIREYGGPALESKEQASVVEDRFAYALTVSGSNVMMPRTYVSSSTGNTRPPDTIEFRFRPAITGSMSLLAHADATKSDIKWNLTLQHTASYSGSGLYGRLNFAISGSNVTSSTPWAPLFDGEYWNIRLTSDNPITASSTTNTIIVSAQKASDSIKGKVTWPVTSSTTFVTTTNIVNAWALQNAGNYLYLGGLSGSIGATASAAFYGNIQGYKEYMEVINNTVYDYHTLNPASYRANNETGSYYNLVRYYPLGLDNKTYNHVTQTYISSSHPSKDRPDYSVTWGRNYATDATASGFVTVLDADNYASLVETYYVYGTSVAGLNARAEKIRLEDNFLVRNLDPAVRGERSTFDTAPLDSNKLNIVFSPQEQINKDVFNNLGYFNLNNYFADPLAEFENEYVELGRLSREYFKKYKSRTDINEYIRAFSLYDFSIFEMLKQFVPLRANLSTGLLIEPHVLERSKVAVTKRPKIENPQWEQTIHAILPTASAETNDYDTTISASALEIASEYTTYETILTGSVSEYTGENLVEYLSIVSESINPGITSDDIIGTDDYIAQLTSSTDTTQGAIYRQINLIRSGSIVTVSSSFSTTASFNGNINLTLLPGGGGGAHTWDSDFYVYYSGISGSGETELSSKYDGLQDSNSYNSFRILVDNGITLTPSGSIQSYYLYVHNLNDDTWWGYSFANLATMQSGVTINLTGATSAQFSNDLNNTGFASVSSPIGNTNTITWTVTSFPTRFTYITSSVSPLEYSPTGSIIDKMRPSYYWKKVIYHYSTGSVNLSKRQKHLNLAISASQNNYYSRSLAIADYKDDESTVLNNLWYEGCKLSAPDINVKSVQTPDGGPVIEVFETNANKIVRQDSSFGTDLIIE